MERRTFFRLVRQDNMTSRYAKLDVNPGYTFQGPHEEELRDLLQTFCDVRQLKFY